MQADFDHCDRWQHWLRCGACKSPLDVCPKGHSGTDHGVIAGGVAYMKVGACPNGIANMDDVSREACNAK